VDNPIISIFTDCYRHSLSVHVTFSVATADTASLGLMYRQPSVYVRSIVSDESHQSSYMYTFLSLETSLSVEYICTAMKLNFFI
jgi:hypothetical protein